MLGTVENVGIGAGLLATTFGLGLRHGVDWDHIAALADLTSSQERPRRAMLLATLYAAGHALVVLVLGSLAILAGDILPSYVDVVMERVVGITLVALGVYVFVALARDRRDFRLRSRWMLIFAAVRRLRRHGESAGPVVIEHEHDHADAHHAEVEALHADHAPAPPTTLAHRHHHRHVGALPEDPFGAYGARTAFGVGVLHGIGAETGTQVLLLVTAANVGGHGTGELLLAAFVLGLVISNTGIALACTVGYRTMAQSFRLYATIAVVTGVFSLVIGTLFLLGQGGVLPGIFAG